MADAIGLGTTLFMDSTSITNAAAFNTSATTCTAVSKIDSMTPPNVAGEDVETTDMAASDGYHTYIPGLVDPGEVTVTLKFDKTQEAALYGKVRTAGSFLITFPDLSHWYFAGYLKSLGEAEVTKGGLMTSQATFKVGDKPEFATS